MGETHTLRVFFSVEGATQECDEYGGSFRVEPTP
jgi:hypothetical protein